MRRKPRTATRRGGLLALLLALLALLGWRLSWLFPGLLPGGGTRPDTDRARLDEHGPRELHLAVLDPATLSPIEGARIHLEDGDGTGPGQGAGGNGRIRLDPDRPAAPGETWEVLSRAPRGGRVRVARTRWTGRVTGPSGAPLSAELHALDAAGRRHGQVRSDAQGHFEIRLDPIDGAPPPLEPGAHLEGRLRGAGPGQLEVYALLPSPARDGLLALATTWPLDADGRYAGTLPADARGWGVFEGRPVALRGGEQELPAAASTRGTVRSRDGDAIPGAWLRFAPWLDAVWEADRPAHEARADAQGHFSLAGLSRVRYHLMVGAPRFATRILDEVDVDGGALAIVLDPGYRIEGIVVDAEAEPVAGVTLRARGLPDPGAERPRGVATSDETGRFVLDGLGGEYAEVWAHGAGAEPLFVGRVEPGADLRVVLPR